MCKKVTARVLAILLIVLLVAAIPAQALAAGASEPQAHTHTLKFLRYSYNYLSNGSSGHIVRTYICQYCTGCGAVFEGTTPVSTRNEQHSYGNRYYNGNNYHSGTLHYAQYEKDCTACKYAYTEWESYKCPGNGHCITPASVIPEIY